MEPNDKNIISDYYEGVQQLELESAEAQVRKARNALFVVAGLTLIVNLIYLSKANALYGAPLYIAILITLLFAGLALLTKKYPFSAIVIGLVIYVGFWIFDIASNGFQGFLGGIIAKVIIIYFLVKGLRYAREAERLRKQLAN